MRLSGRGYSRWRKMAIEKTKECLSVLVRKLFSSARYAWLQAFFYALLISAVVFLPFVIMDKGLFFYYGDFNVQQIPFYQLVHRAVKSGDFYWNWYTDLGANFIGSYSFYNLFSPFFWLTLPFSNSAVPYLIAPLLVLKTACAALTGSLYTGRFVKDHRYAVLGGLLYAFSGFTTYNIFFNHFHEVIVFFPLILYALELLVTEGRRGIFALAVAVNCMVNYWFFIGSVVFVLIYFAVRCISRGWEMTWRKFFTIALEAVLGVLLACFALVPSVLAIMGNPRTTSDNLLMGWNFWLYGHVQRIPAILESLFFPPDIPSRPNFFPDHGAKWASLSAWLPMIGPAFVLAHQFTQRKSWLKRMLWLCLCIALVPGLNALFILLNNSYYARWFYMPTLLMALASVLALERARSQSDTAALMRGMRISGIIILIITFAIGLTPHKDEDGKIAFGLCEYPDRFWIYCAITIVGLAASIFIVRRFLKRPAFFRVFGIALAVVCAAYSITMITMGRQHSNKRDWMRSVALDGAAVLPDLEEPGRLDRVDLYDSMDNLGMYWRLPNIQAFHSIIPVSLMEFYPSVGVKRDVSSKPQPELFELRSLLSVRWLFVPESAAEDKQPSTSYFRFVGSQLDYNVYENENYLPMGIPYDAYITQAQFENTSKELRARLLMKGVLVEGDDVKNVRKFLDPISQEDLQDFTEERFLYDVGNRRSSIQSNTFNRDNHGFTSEITLDKEQIVFYSVPYDKGWTANVNGEPTKALKVQNGFLGVPVKAGSNVIRFDYETPGLRVGILLSIGALLILAAYLLIARRFAPLCVRTAPDTETGGAPAGTLPSLEPPSQTPLSWRMDDPTLPAFEEDGQDGPIRMDFAPEETFPDEDIPADPHPDGGDPPQAELPPEPPAPGSPSDTPQPPAEDGPQDHHKG